MRRKLKKDLYVEVNTLLSNQLLKEEIRKILRQNMETTCKIYGPRRKRLQEGHLWCYRPAYLTKIRKVSKK